MVSLIEKETIIVIGNGMVGCKFCEKLREKDTTNQYNIITFCEEKAPAYDRVHLTEFFNGKSQDDLILKKIEWYEENNITLHLGDKIIEIDRKNKTVTSALGKKLPYSKIILATGSAPFVPPVKGIDKKGVFVYRTLEDLENIRLYAKTSTTATVVGGGLLGLEAAKAAKDLGLKTKVIEFAPRLMARQLDDGGALLLKKFIEKSEIEVLLNKSTSEIRGNGKVTGMTFDDGSKIDTDMIIVSAGIRPRDELARKCGIEIGERGGVIVNKNMQTSDADILAIGEVALYENFIYGLVAPGYHMAETAACFLTGSKTEFTGADMSTKLKLIGTDVASFGNYEPRDIPHKEIILDDSVKGIYKKLVVSEDGKTLLGGMLVGDAAEYGTLLQITLNKMPLPENPLELILPKTGCSGKSASPIELPDTAQICSCENVTKGDICKAIKEKGLTTVAEIKKCTKAGTGCGGCIPLLTQVLNQTLKAQGKEINTALCSHFKYTRTELYEIIKSLGIKTFKELINSHGQGIGCEICKPTAGSIFASLWNEPILNQQFLQDTNDMYLANMQKDGTYSIVPRIPGGEIIPDQLIVLGTVAKKYNLYTKITGGQRVDLFGAHLNDLPQIWEELILAGFESGHAYAKGLRTVKSCVGSTWCRFGVQDSTSMAIDIENRYKGLRSPHKLKSAVSGCARECAEAQSKDFGVIATEKGWNLYVCGNGGMKPQHAVLLATDIDDETLIKYIDRFLMYYIKTADRLTRTATWLNGLEGGLEHLKDVVINDSLGICKSLEDEMQELVNKYHCEWKNAVENPKIRKRFQHFINSKSLDESVKYIKSRGQKSPAETELIEVK